ncbi:MAG: LptF/LptG family permease [Phycisphaeraceae bacterium]|nr:LptF/LptG family permease [Phycisphaeraceae bacterium]
MRSAPITLWLYVLKDMWRQILLTAGVLVTVLAFALVVKPLAEGLLSPWQCLQLIGLSMLPAMQYALPFAACFGATLSYYRLSSDNEIIAAQAGGVSHRSLIMPAIGSGVVLFLVLLVLSNFVIPRFLHRGEQLVAVNAATFIESTIKRGRAVRTDVQGRPAYIYADTVRRIEDSRPSSGRASAAGGGGGGGGDAASAANVGYERLWLSGILFVTFDSAGQIAWQGSAREAIVWLRRRPTPDADGRSSTEVVLKPVDFVGVQGTGRAQGGEAIQTFRIPNSMKEDPKFLSFGELRRLSRTPDLLGPIDERRRRLALALAEIEVADQTRDALRSQGAAEFIDSNGTTRYVLRGADLRRVPRDPRWWRIRPDPGSRAVTVERYSAEGGAPIVQRAGAGWLRVGISNTLDGPDQVGVHIRLQGVSAQVVGTESAGGLGGTGGAGGGSAPAFDDPDAPGEALPPDAAGAISEWNITELRPATDLASVILGQPSPMLQQMSDNRLAVSAREAESLVAPLAELRRATASLLREIFSKQQERIAMAAACLVMVALGSIMAMRLRESLPLKIYLWAFFPALAAVLTISTGQQMTHRHGMMGLLVLWGGVAMLAAYAVVEFRRLARH